MALGAWWVLRVPPPPPESAIAFATTSVVSSGGTNNPGVAAIPTFIRVHVAGEVLRPGVYQLPGTARVVDAVDAAGGPTAHADVDVINLAAALFDAAQIFVPRRGSVVVRAPITALAIAASRSSIVPFSRSWLSYMVLRSPSPMSCDVRSVSFAETVRGSSPVIR